MNEQDFHTVDMMTKYGGSFVKALAELCHRADASNLQKIKDAWPEYWKQYSEMK